MSARWDFSDGDRVSLFSNMPVINAEEYNDEVNFMKQQGSVATILEVLKNKTIHVDLKNDLVLNVAANCNNINFYNECKLLLLQFSV
jgi:sRNA-binding protein